MCKILSILLLLLIFPACGSDNSSDPFEPVVLLLGFESGDEGVSTGFSDYPAGREEDMELGAGVSELPGSFQDEGNGYMISGSNLSDDLFLFFKKRIDVLDGLEPNTPYVLDMTIDFATNAGSGCVGIGGAPGESVYIKAGAATREPLSSPENGDMRLNLDKGNQAGGGTDAVVIGNMANGTDDCQGGTWVIKTLTLEGFAISTDDAGEIWVMVGSDSGFEGITTWYLDFWEIHLVPVDS